MSRVFGVLFCFCFAWLAIDAIASSQYVAASVFTFALVVALLELMRKTS